MSVRSLGALLFRTLKKYETVAYQRLSGSNFKMALVIAKAALFETFLTVDERSIMFYAISSRSRRGRMND